MIYAYARCSTHLQNLDRQLVELLPLVDVALVEKVSGRDDKRPQLKLLMDIAKVGDVVYASSMDRFSRSIQQLNTLVPELRDRGVVVKFLKENLTLSKDKSDMMSKILFSNMSLMAEIESDMISSRVKAGAAVAIKKGHYIGRQGRKFKFDKEVISQLKAEGNSVSFIANKLNTSRQTIYTYLKGEHKKSYSNRESYMVKKSGGKVDAV